MCTLLAQTATVPGVANTLSELTGMALVGGCFVIVLRWLLDKNNREMQELTKAIHINSLLLLQVQREQIRHDSICAGLKCQPEQQDNEHWRRVATSYENIAEEIKRATEAITQMMK